MRTPGDAAGDLVDRRGFASEVEKGCRVSYLKKEKETATPFCYKVRYNCGTHGDTTVSIITIIILFITYLFPLA